MSLNAPDFLGPETPGQPKYKARTLLHPGPDLAQHPQPPVAPEESSDLPIDPRRASINPDLATQAAFSPDFRPRRESYGLIPGAFDPLGVPNPNQAPFAPSQSQFQPDQFRTPDFDSLLRSKLAVLEQEASSPLHNAFSANPGAAQTAQSAFAPQWGQNWQLGKQPPLSLGDAGQFNAFHLPKELQGGIGTILSRRPSYAAESFTRNVPAPSKLSLASYAAINSYSLNRNKQAFDQMVDSLDGFSLNANFTDFQARRPSQLANYAPFDQDNLLRPQNMNQPGRHEQQNMAPAQSLLVGEQSMNVAPGQPPLGQQGHPPSAAGQASSQQKNAGQKQSFSRRPNYGHPDPYGQMQLDQGLVLRGHYILASPELKMLYSSASRYFQDKNLSNSVLGKLKELFRSEVVQKLINFIKNLNNLTFNHRMLCLVINKNGKLDLLSYPNNSNIYLQQEDLVIVDGDRGKDLVMILDPHVPLDMAILFNFLKKIEHLKSLTIIDNHRGSSVKNNHCGGTHSASLDANSIVNSHTNEDNEFIISLPTKQVLRFATPKDVHKLSGKFLEEKKAFMTCYNKIKELGLSNELTLINVEYQCDFKKLIFYYFAKFKRIDFRGLIKELFKIYKTRIWLCAVLPHDRPELHTKNNIASSAPYVPGRIPQEYDLTNEQIVNFSIALFNQILAPSYFHMQNMSHLIDDLTEDLKGNFYGFNKAPSTERRKSHVIRPNFNPFGSEEKNI